MRTIIILCSMAIMLVQCKNPSKNDRNIIPDKSSLLNISFKNAIDSIDKEIVDLTWVAGLLELEKFRCVYNNPERYIADALLFISDTSNNEHKKSIVVCSMLNLPDDQFISFF